MWHYKLERASRVVGLSAFNTGSEPRRDTRRRRSQKMNLGRAECILEACMHAWIRIFVVWSLPPPTQESSWKVMIAMMAMTMLHWLNICATLGESHGYWGLCVLVFITCSTINDSLGSSRWAKGGKAPKALWKMLMQL